MSITPTNILLFIGLGYIAYIFAYLLWLLIVNELSISRSKKYSRIIKNAEKNYLIIGDSLAFGVGAPRKQSIAGLLAEQFPQSNIYNLGKNRAHTKKLAKNISQIMNDLPTINTTILSIGSNDAIRMKPLKKLNDKISYIVESIHKNTNGNVYIISPTKPGKSPRLLKFLARKRLAHLRAIFMSLESENIKVVDLWPDSSILLSEPNKYFAADTLHFSAEGQKYVFTKLLKTMQTQDK
jgi:lysophospholipase L1-like esterase